MSEKVWLSQYPEEIPTTLTYEEMPVQNLLTRAYEKNPDKIAIHFMGKELTYKELYESSLKFANYLRDLGVEKGDRVAIMLPNCPQAVIAYYRYFVCRWNCCSNKSTIYRTRTSVSNGGFWCKSDFSNGYFISTSYEST